MHSSTQKALSDLTDVQLAKKRDKIRYNLFRSSTATALAVCVSIALAAASVFYAVLAEKSASEARSSSQRRTEELWNAQMARSMALRLSDKLGRRAESLNAIAQAVSIRPSMELLTEAIATLALLDVQPGSFWQNVPPRVCTVGFSSNLDFYALGDGVGKVEIFKAENHENTGFFEHTNHQVISLQFSPDHRYVAARFTDGAVKVWDNDSKKLVFQSDCNLAFYSDKSTLFHPRLPRLLVVCHPNTLHVINTDTWRELPSLKVNGQPRHLCFSPNAEELAVATDGKIEVYKFEGWKPERTLDCGPAVNSLDWHPGGRILGTAHGDGHITLVDRSTGKRQLLEGHTMHANRVLFDPQGEVVISTSWDGTTRFWDIASGRLLLASQAGYAFSFDPSGRRLYYYKEGIGLGEWSYVPPTGFSCLAVPIGNSRRILRAEFSVDSCWLAGATTEGIHLWHVASRQHAGFVPLEDSQGVAFSDDGKFLVATTGKGLYRIPLLMGATQSAITAGSPEVFPETAGRSYWLGFATASVGKDRWLAASSPKDVAVVNLGLQESARIVNWEGGRRSAAVSPDGRHLVVSAWKGGGTRVLDLQEPSNPRVLEDEGGLAFFSADGRQLLVGASTEFIFYELGTWVKQKVLKRDISSALSGIAAFSPNGKLLAVTHTARQVRLLSSDGAELLGILDAPYPQRVTSLAFSPDSRQLVATTDNRVAHLWNLEELRKNLSEMKLEWGQKTPLSATPAPPFPHRNYAFRLAGVGAFLAVMAAIFVLWHHRRLLKTYAEVEVVATERRRILEETQEQLLHSQKMKALGTLAAGIAHDFNNLLSIIGMSSQLVARKMSPEGETRENLDGILQAVAQGKSIVRSILGYSRQTGDKNEVFSVSSLVAETLAMLNQGFLSGLVLTLELEPNAPQARGDKNRLEQILLNLIVNASEAMHGCGKLVLKTQTKTDPGRCLLAPRSAKCYIELAVEDAGPGIPPDVLPHIFEPFFSTKQSGADRGTGLGLTSVYTIAQEEGFGLDVITQEGKGTLFRILIPVVDAKKVQSPDLMPRLGATCPLHKRELLLYDPYLRSP